MRDRFKGIADTWHEATDASKHVFEVRLACYKSPFILLRYRLGHLHRDLLDTVMEVHIPSPRDSLCAGFPTSLALVGKTTPRLLRFRVSFGSLR